MFFDEVSRKFLKLLNDSCKKQINTGRMYDVIHRTSVLKNLLIKEISNFFLKNSFQQEQLKYSHL